MKVLVIGGYGFIGSYVVNQLVLEGFEVTVLIRRSANVSISGVRKTIIAPRLSDVADHLRHSAYTSVIHTAAMTAYDAKEAVDVFRHSTERVIILSSGDVYRAYDIFVGKDPGPIDARPLVEDSEIRRNLYPYRTPDTLPGSREYDYDKTLVERAFIEENSFETVVLRLPKVYGPEQNFDFASVIAYKDFGGWRWTHGYVENVASAIVLSTTGTKRLSNIFNVGELYTPSVAERISALPANLASTNSMNVDHYNFDQDIVYDTSRIRIELGYTESVSYEEGISRTLERRRN